MSRAGVSSTKAASKKEPPQRSGARALGQDFVNEVSGPSLADAGLVDAVGAFCENIAFTLEECERLLRATKQLELPAHVHAGQLSDMGAAEVAAKWGALSADHLEYLSAAGADRMRGERMSRMSPATYAAHHRNSPA